MDGLYLVADFNGCSRAAFLSKVEDALDGGVDVVQLRAKVCDDENFLELAQHVKELCEARQKPLLINDRIEIALRIHAHGVHLGAGDVSTAEARNILGRRAVIGRSIAVHQVPTKDFEGADYVAASPVFYSQTKPEAGYPFGLDELSRLVRLSKKPVVAIGGITIKNAKSILETGCRSIAVVSAIMNSSSPRSQAMEFKKIMGGGHHA